MSVIVYEFACGHYGRDSDSPRAKVVAFIRVAALRGARTEKSYAKCPDCSPRGR